MSRCESSECNRAKKLMILALQGLHRAYFARAIMEEDVDPLQSPFSASVVAVIDAARRMISTTITSWNRFPSVSGRWAFLWVRTFSAGVSIGACVSTRVEGS